MQNDKSLNDTQIREIITTEIGSKDYPFDVQMIRILFATYIIKENVANPRQFKDYAAKMGTSVGMLMINYAQVAENEDNDEYQGLGDMLEEENKLERQKNKKTKKRIIFFLYV